MSPRPSVQKKVQKLLQLGKSVNAIARELSLSRIHVVHIRNRMIQDRRIRNKKPSRLESQYLMIRNGVASGLKATQIHAQLKQEQLRCSYSTVARFVARLKKKEFFPLFPTMAPGQEAKVFFFYTGRFWNKGKKLPIWIFVMHLTYSRYCWYSAVTVNDFDTFLRCHEKAFCFFNGIPRTIKCSKTKAFDFHTPGLWDRYCGLLANMQCQLMAKNSRSHCIQCSAPKQHFDERFRAYVLHQHFSRLARDLERWYSSEVNLRIHPEQKKVVKKVFVELERPALRPLLLPTNQTSSHAHTLP